MFHVEHFSLFLMLISDIIIVRLKFEVHKMGKVVSIFNQKGGVGKTTTSINLSAGLGKLGKNILLIDLDPQGNSTSGLGLEKREMEHLIYDVLAMDLPIKKAVFPTTAENLSIIPSNSQLAGLEIELAKEGNWEERLKSKLKDIKVYLVLFH